MPASWQATIVNESGDIQSSAQITVRIESSGALAPLFSDRDGIVPLTNPFNADEDGFVRFYAAGNSYRIDAALNGFSRTWRHVPIGVLGEYDTLPSTLIKYDRTAAEIAAGVTPTNYAYEELNVLRYGADRTAVSDSQAAFLSAAKVAMASKQASGVSPVYVFIPDGEYRITTGIPIASGLVYRSRAPWSATLTCTGSTAAVYSCTYSAGTFTDNLSATLGQVQAGTHSAANCGLINIFVDHTGTISGNAPSGAAWASAVQLVGVPDSVIENIAVSCTTNNKNGLSLRFSWRAQITRPTIAKSGGGSGGTGLLLDSQCNAVRISGPFLQGNHAIGIDLAGSNSITVIEPSVELGNDVGVRLGGVAPRLLGGYYEGNGVDIQLGVAGSPVNRALVMMPWLNGSSSTVAIDIVASVASRIMNPYVTGTYSTSTFNSTASASENYGNIIEVQVGDANDSAQIATLGLDGGRNIIRFVGENNDDHRFYREYKSSDSMPMEQQLNQRGAGFNCFQVHLVNTGGTLQVMVTDGDDAAPEFDGCFVATSATLINIPDVAAGAGFGSSPAGRLSGTNSVIVLNTNANTINEQAMIVGALRTNRGTLCPTVQLRYQSRNINGVTRVRPELVLRDPFADTTFDFDTTNFTAGEYIKIPVLGFVA